MFGELGLHRLPAGGSELRHRRQRGGARSESASAASRSAAFWRIPTSNASSPVPATSVASPPALAFDFSAALRSASLTLR